VSGLSLVTASFGGHLGARLLPLQTLTLHRRRIFFLSFSLTFTTTFPPSDSIATFHRSSTLTMKLSVLVLPLLTSLIGAISIPVDASSNVSQILADRLPCPATCHTTYNAIMNDCRMHHGNKSCNVVACTKTCSASPMCNCLDACNTTRACKVAAAGTEAEGAAIDSLLEVDARDIEAEGNGKIIVDTSAFSALVATAATVNVDIANSAVSNTDISITPQSTETNERQNINCQLECWPHYYQEKAVSALACCP
jgi:hypothetical protein